MVTEVNPAFCNPSSAGTPRTRRPQVHGVRSSICVVTSLYPARSVWFPPLRARSITTDWLESTGGVVCVAHVAAMEGAAMRMRLGFALAVGVFAVLLLNALVLAGLF